MMFIHFFCFRPEIPRLGKFSLKTQICQFQLKLGTYNHFHDILRLFDVLLNFPFTTSETIGDYYLQAWYIRVDPRVAQQLKTRILGN